MVGRLLRPISGLGRRRLQYRVATTNSCRSYINKAPDAVHPIDEQPPLARSDALVLMEALRREGVTDVFTSRDGAFTVETPRALRREGVTDVFTTRDQAVAVETPREGEDSVINTHVFLSRGSEVSGAIGYAMATGLPGVCFTSVESYVELRHQFWTAYKYKIPILVMVADGWYNKREYSDPFDNRQHSRKSSYYGRLLDEIVKCRFRITSGKEIPKVVRAALCATRSGIPGPVAIDQISDDILHKMDIIPLWAPDVVSEALTPRRPITPLLPTTAQLEEVIALLKQSKRPLLYVEHACFEWRKELSRFVDLTGIPVFRYDTPIYLTDRHSSPTNRFFLERFDLLLALDIRSTTFFHEILECRRSDSVVVRIGEDCDDEEESQALALGDEKKKFEPGSVSSIVCGDIKSMFGRLNRLLEEVEEKEEGKTFHFDFDFSTWRKEINVNESQGFLYKSPIGRLVQQFVNEIASRGNTFLIHHDLSEEYCRHKFWDWFAFVPYGFEEVDSGFRMELPLCIGVAIGKRRVDKINATVIYSMDTKSYFHFQYVDELFFLMKNKLSVKVVVMNRMLENKEQRRNRPDFVSIAGSLGIPCRRIVKEEEVRDAMDEMTKTSGPYVLDVVLSDPNIPGLRLLKETNQKPSSAGATG